MAARPYILWDPGANAALHVLPGSGPLVVTGADADRARWNALVAPSILPRHFADPIVPYQIDMRPTTAGLRVRGYQYMPQGLAFLAADPVHREPRPFDSCDPWGGASWPYIAVGYRLGIRGWVGTRAAGGLNTAISARWADSAARLPAEARGAWTGIALSAFAAHARSARYLASMLHGKRRGDAAWEYRAGWLDTPEAPIGMGEIAAPWAASDGRVRIVSAGGGGAWDLTMQYWDPAVGPSGDWVTGLVQNLPLWSHDPANKEGVTLIASLVAGATQWQPGAPLAWPAQEMTFPDLELEQLEPWLIDVADWGVREWDQAWAWTAPPGPPPVQEVRRSHSDLGHMPLGHPWAPLALRTFDAALGWHMELGPDTVIMTLPDHDLRGIAVLSPSDDGPLAVCDEAAYGPDAPLAVVWRVRLRDLDLLAVGERRSLWASGNIFAAVPSTVNNGIGVFVIRDGADAWRLIARAYSRPGGWADATLPLDGAALAAWGDRPISIAWAWTGARGGRAGHPSRSLRLVIDGTTAATLPNLPLFLNNGTFFRVGFQDPGTMRGVACDLGPGAVFGEALTDEEIAGAFVEVTGPFQNPSFEVASADGRPGEAEAWAWTSYQQAGGWAEFNAGDPALQAWQRAREDFAAGWEHVEDWIDAWALGLITAALFNEGVPAFETAIELFALWGWPDAGPATYVGRPWLDAWTLTAPPDERPDPTGWTGWYDAIMGTHLYPLADEQFREAWDTDPLSTFGGALWQPGTAVGGRLRGRPLAWPVTLPPERAWLWLFSDLGQLLRLALTPGTYADAPALAAMLEAAFVAQVGPGTGATFGAWSGPAGSGVDFGWDGLLPSLAIWVLGRRALDPWAEARPYLGFSGLGPWGTASEIVLPASMAGTLPPGVGAAERIWLDSWTLNDWATWPDSRLGIVVLEYEQVGALFDTGSGGGSTSVVEWFEIPAWVGPAAAWIPEWLPGDLTPAVFDMNTMETFQALLWPTELFPT